MGIEPIVVAVIAGIAFCGGGFLGWRLGVSSEAQVRKIAEDVSKGNVIEAVKDAKGP